MLNTPAPFPEVGSWALYERVGQTVAARITFLAPDRKSASISFPDAPTASGSFTVGVDQLLDATPLTIAETEEMARLSSYLCSLAQPERSGKHARFEELRQREIRARSIVEILGRLNRTRLGTGATRAAEQTFSAAISATQRRAAA